MKMSKEYKTRKIAMLRGIMSVAFSTFLTYLTIQYFMAVAGATTIMNIYVLSIILIFLYSWIILKLSFYYIKFLNSILFKLFKIKLKNAEAIVPVIWLPSSILSSITSITLFIISNHYRWIVIKTLEYKINYEEIILDLNSRYIPPLIVISVLIGFILQILILNKYYKIKLMPSVISSIINIALFTIGIAILRNVILVILGMF